MLDPIRILLVDDSPYFLEAARDFLQFQEVLTVVDVANEEEEALSKSLRGNPDVILLDLNLAHRSGLELIPLFRQQVPQVKIIVLTMMEAESYRTAAMRAGADAFVHKTTMSKTLISAILETMSRDDRSANLTDQDNPARQGANENASRFLRLAEHLPDLIYRYEYAPTRGFTYVSPAATAMTGYTPEDHYADPDLGFKLVHPDDHHLLQDIAEGRADMQSPLVLRWIHKDGTVFWTEQRNVPIFDESGALIACEGVARDITERVKAGEDIRFQSMLVENMHGAVISTDADFKIRSWNKSAERMFGYTADEVIGRPSREVVISEFVGTSREEVIKQLMETGRWEGEVIITSKDGARIHTFTSSSVIKDAAGRTIGMLAINRDITERIKAGEKLLESEARYRALFEQSHDAVFILDTQGNHIAANRRAAEMLGYTVEEIQTLSVRELSAELEKSKNVLMRLLAGEPIPLFMRRFRKKDGEIIPVEINVELVRDVNGNPLHIQSVVRDISGRMQAEQALRQSEDRYRDLVENSQDLICTHDFEGVILSTNLAAERLLGYEVDELVGGNLRDIMPPEVRGHFKYYINRLKRNGSASGLMIVQTKAGERRFWEYQNTVRTEGVAQPIARGMARDVTERKRAEEEIRRLNEFNENLIHNMSEGIVVQNTQGHFMFVNPAVSSITGFSPEELLGGHWTKFFPADQHDIVVEADNRRLAGLASQYEIDFLHKSGKRINLLVSGSPLFENGRFNGSMAVFTDITERKQAEKKIRRQFDYLTALREIDQSIISSFDMQLSLSSLVLNAVNLLAVDAVSVLLLNPALKELEYGAGLGFRTHQAKAARVKLGESHAGRVALERRVIQISNLADEPGDPLLKGFVNSEGFVSYYGVPLVVKGKVIGVLEVFHRSFVERDREWFDFFNSLAAQASIAIENARLFEDLQKKKLELELRVQQRTAELTKANRAKDEFLAGMSHELRTPLNAVLSLSESLEEGTYGELKPRQVDVLRIIAESGRHLLELINDILDLSKIEAGKLELQAALTAVEPLCRAAIRMVKENAHQKGLQISASNTSNIEVIYADERRMKQMLVNLLSNAVKFTPQGGEVGLEVSKEGDHAIRFTVWDTGIGIPADQLGKLFKPFVQLDSSLSRQYAGTGLGLALVHNLAELHGGSVGVESEPGKGSRFYITIPTRLLNPPIVENVKKLTAQSKPNETVTQPKARKSRILLVEDNATNMIVTSDYLNDKGYQVVEARDGTEALEYARRENPELILMDIQLPGMNGLEVIARLRAAPGFDSVPIIALTALAMPGDRERCLAAGANEYVTKPASLKNLVEMMESLLRK